MARKETKNAQVVISTGRRKKSIARVRLMPGTGKFTVNGREMKEYLQTDILLMVAQQLKGVYLFEDIRPFLCH